MLGNMHLLEIKKDLFDIAKRLKEIDRNYLVFYNRKNSCFEVHNTRQKGNTFCLSVPYKVLDARTIDLVFKTRIENAEKLLAELEENNLKMELTKAEKTKNFGEMLQEMEGV